MRFSSSAAQLHSYIFVSIENTPKQPATKYNITYIILYKSTNLNLIN